MSGPSNPERVSFAYQVGEQQISVVFDASINEQHGGQAQATEHPVEAGANITDNVRPTPLKLTLEAMVSNTPIDGQVLAPSVAANGSPSSAAGYGLTFPEQFDRVKDVTEALFAAQQAGALVSVVTTLTSYENMAIVNIAIPRNAENSNAVHVTIDLQQVLLVEVNTVAALAQKHQLVSRGNKPPKPVEPEAKEQLSRSALKGFVGLVTGAK